MTELQAAQTEEQVLQAGLQLVIDRLKPERALIFYGQDESGQIVPRAGHNLDPNTVMALGDVSLGILEDALAAGEPKMLVDALQDPRFGERTSAVLSGIRSVLSAPLREGAETVGLIYLDSRIQKAAFKQADLPWLAELATAMEQRLATV